MRALLILHLSLLATASAFAQAEGDGVSPVMGKSAVAAGLPSFPAVPNGSEIKSSVEEGHLVVRIRIKSGLAFFRANRTRRQSYATTCPALSFVSKIGTEQEQRLIVLPKNVRRQFDAPPKRITLCNQDGEDVGTVEIHSAKEVDYRIRLGVVSQLGTSLVVIPGNPAIHRIEIQKAEQGGAGKPATVPESKPEGKAKPNPESEGRSQ